MNQGEEPPQQLSAHLHMLSLKIVSMSSSKLLKLSEMNLTDIALNDSDQRLRT